MKFNPWPYQQAAVDWIIQHKRCGLFLEMGLGKTVITLTALERLLSGALCHSRQSDPSQKVKSQVLIVAPLRVAQTVWAEEAQKWDHLKNLRFVKLLGPLNKRLDALNELFTDKETPTTFYVINRENVQWLVEQCAAKKTWPFDILVIDELSSFKSPKAQRFRSLRRVLPATRRVIGLTGTPSPNGLIDLWSQLYLLDRGERLGKTLGWYRDNYFVPGDRYGAIVYNWRLKPGAEDGIYKRISDICMSMKAEDYLSLPERHDISVPVALSDREKQAYDVMERDLVLPIASERITAQNAAVLTGKLLQLSNGAIYNESRDYYEIHSRKLDALEDLIEAANGQNVLVYYGFQHDADRLLRRFPEARQLRTSADVKDWNEGRVPLMIAHPASAGHGLNLQAGGHIVIWFGLTWSLELYQQANARLFRQGQQHPVTVYHVITQGTVDEEVLKVLTGKAEKQEALIDAVKARIELYAG